MEERQIISKLKELREVKPGNDWKEATRAYIVGIEHSQEKVFLGGFSLPFRHLLNQFNPVKLAPAFISAIIVVLVGAGIFSYFYIGSPEGVPGGTGVAGIQENSATYLVLAETKLEQIKSPEDVKQVTEMLEKAADIISSEAKDPSERAKIVESVTNINRKVQELDSDDEGAEEIANLKDKASTLTAVTAHAVEENIGNITEDLVKNLIQMMKTRNLSDEQEELFKEAKLDYNNQEFEKALEKILLLSNSN